MSDCRGLLFRTEDGGDSWEQVYSGDVAPLALQFGPDGIGWLAGGPASVGTYTSLLRGAAGTLLLTEDGGESWVPVYSGEGADGAFLSVSFTSTTDGWIGTAAGRLLQTVDGGTTWTRGSASCANWVSFVSPDQGFAFCGFPVNPGPGVMSKSFLRTTDSGATWQVMDSVNQPHERRVGGLPLTGYGSGFMMRTETDGWIALSRGGLLYTRDAGATWEGIDRDAQTVGAEDVDYSEAQGVQFLSETHGFALFNRRYLMETTDGGSTWRLLLEAVQLPLTLARPVADLPTSSSDRDSLAWSPDGQRLAYNGPEHQLFLLDLTSPERPRQITPGWARDGQESPPLAQRRKPGL